MRTGSERGQALLMVTTALIAMFGILGLAVDIGWAYFKKESAQSAAEAAALSSAKAALDKLRSGATLSCGSAGVSCASSQSCPSTVPATPADNFDVACIYADANGFRTGGNSGRQAVVVSSGISTSAPTVPGVALSYWVTTIVSERTPQLFSAVLGNLFALPVARATAGLVTSDTCIYVLDANSKNSFSVTGSSILTSQCGIIVNSTDPQAMVTTGNACVTASSIRVAGSWTTSSSCPLSPTPVAGASPLTDPLASLSMPGISGCNVTDFKTNSDATINPGVYCGGIKVTGGTITMNPGTYIMNGGGFTATGGAIIQGTGVTIFNTGSGGAYQPISIGGGTHVVLSAPTSGPMEGILFFQDRTVTSNAQNTLTGDDTSQFTGTLYFPTTPLKFSGNNASTEYSIIVAYNLAVVGNAAMNDNYTSLSTGGPLATPTLIE